ncbi:reticulon-4-interacting protein [Verticillium alfalfae VaMs.102]|uniref:Reticulon-4-interacting protein n=1 Tax=Verticillium alfalfae (strain VaMs.102 / ATCC MYA-4576 / FGSC 10136) TaxID=526221 RepID=C9SNN5_VERA1|nr:reticulon-4-interacting protein [Verticillium alfalfae VaMs.102]EEY20400.1 reticulon-4-interacting protein [Verticillium alfalfae VaMs.102]
MATQDTPQMRVYQIDAPGPIANMKLVTVPRPSETLEKEHILVKVIVAGINPADYKLPELGILSKAKLSYPICPGMDFAGQVVAVGEGVPDIKVGDNVLGRMGPLKWAGSLSEYAGAAGTAALTAYQTIAPYAKAGDKVFINGGSGGTGTYGIQIAKAIGCHVTVSCSTSKAALCKELGADEIIDYKTTNVTAKLREIGPVFSVIVDNVGDSPPDLFSASDAILLPSGHYKFVGGHFSFQMATHLASGLLLPKFLGGVSHKFEAFMTKNSHEDLAQLATWMGEGKVKTVVDSAFGFEQVYEAFEKLKVGSAAGKIVVHVQENKT